MKHSRAIRAHGMCHPMSVSLVFLCFSVEGRPYGNVYDEQGFLKRVGKWLGLNMGVNNGVTNGVNNWAKHIVKHFVKHVVENVVNNLVNKPLEHPGENTC